LINLQKTYWFVLLTRFAFRYFQVIDIWIFKNFFCWHLGGQIAIRLAMLWGGSLRTFLQTQYNQHAIKTYTLHERVRTDSASLMEIKYPHMIMQFIRMDMALKVDSPEWKTDWIPAKYQMSMMQAKVLDIMHPLLPGNLCTTPSNIKAPTC
jgi:hypothetical protein